jgi:hypothetical protein
MRIAATLLVLSLAGCAPDPVLGTFTFNMTGTDTESAPRSQTNSTSGGGTFSVTTGKSVDYVVTLSQTDTSPCVLDADKAEKGDAINLAANQKCTFNYSGGTVTATLTTGTLTGSEKGETAAVTVNYTYAGTIIGINFAGTGTRTYSGVRR